MPHTEYAFQALGTHWHIDIEDLPHHLAGGFLLEEIKNTLETFEALYSRFRPNSLVSLLAKNGGTAPLPPDAEPLLARYAQLYRLTEGTVTPLIGQVLSDAGYDAAYSLTPKKLSHPPRWEDVLHITPSTITLEQPTQLDFGALGKGYAIDIITQHIEHYGLRSFCVEAGGDMAFRTATTATLRVGLEHPEDPSRVIGVATLKNHQSICGSAGNRRAWATFHHIINPHTLESPRNILAVWALANSTLEADALTSGLFFTTPQILATEFLYEYAIMYADHSVKYSPHFPGEFF